MDDPPRRRRHRVWLLLQPPPPPHACDRAASAAGPALLDRPGQPSKPKHPNSWHNFNGLSLDVLASIGVDAGQRISATLMPVNETPDPVYASDRAAYVARLDRDCDAHLRKLNALSACITQLVALEHVYLERVDAMIESVSQYPNVGTATAKTSSE